MVLSKEKLIYIHIPKTGGVSIEEFLQSYYGYTRNAFLLNHGYGTYNSKSNAGFTIYPHMHYPLRNLIKELNNNNIEVDNTWNIFSIVRNPYNKFISALFYAPRNDFKYNYTTLPENQRGYYLNKSLDNYLDSDINDNYHSNHIYPQHKFFEGTDLNYKVFKFEDGLENALINLGFKVKDKIKHFLNTSNYIGYKLPPYETMYTKYFVEYINTTYAKDFEEFGYEMLDPNTYP